MYINKDFNHSYWERKHIFKSYDFIIAGAGIVGLSTAISIKNKNKKANILIIEAGILPNGASTKNAGFACFGSAGEILDDLSQMPETMVMQTVKMRWQGLNLLRKRLGDKALDYKAYGGFELFDSHEKFETCEKQLPYLNKHFKQITGQENCFKVIKKNNFGFKNNNPFIKNQFEGQIDTGLMMHNLSHLAFKLNIEIIYACELLNFEQINAGVQLNTNIGQFNCHKLIIATNGFAKNLINDIEVNAARAQVLITKQIKNLKVKGSFHFDKGYYYFRNIDNRLLLGGGRNLDFETENTDQFELNKKIQLRLEKLLKENILHNTPFEIDYRWTGIMGLGKEKKPIIQYHEKNVIVAVRMGGMGVAIGSMVGEEVSKII